MHNTMPLVCPECKGHLATKEDSLICQRCGKNYPVRDGIPDFIGSFEYWGETDRANMEKALETARKEGYLSALAETVIGRRVSGRYLFSSRRVDWIFHCFDPKRSKTCLDVGSGLGILSLLLSNFFDEIWSLEPVWERLKFQEIAKNQEKLHGLNLVRGLAHKLPFANNYFDLVVANGVLEWVALGELSRDPMEIQLNFLRETHRTLREGGCLYVGIENRISFKNFLGARDHSGLPFTSLLPRKLAGALTSLASGAYQKRLHDKRVHGYRTYTYSLLGYLKLLRKAGFLDIDFYWTNDYNYPKFSSSIEDSQAFNFFLENEVSPYAIKEVYLSLPASLQRLFLMLFCPTFLIYAYKGCRGETLETHLLKKLSAEKCSFLRVSGSDYDDANITYFLMGKGKNDLHVVKIPRFKHGLETLDLKEKRLSIFNNLSFEKTYVGDTTIYLEKKIPGNFMDVLNLHHNLLALKWLMDFQDRTRKGPFSSGDLDSELSILREYLSSMKVSTELRNEVSDDLESLFGYLKRRKLEKTSEHGDYCAENILIKGEKVFVIDWEDYTDSGNPLFDFGFFLVMNSSYTGYHRASVRALALYRNFIGKGRYSGILEEITRRFLKVKNLGPETISQLIPYAMVKYIREHDPRSRRWKQNFIFFHDLLKLWYEKEEKINEFLHAIGDFESDVQQRNAFRGARVG